MSSLLRPPTPGWSDENGLDLGDPTDPTDMRKGGGFKWGQRPDAGGSGGGGGLGLGGGHPSAGGTPGSGQDGGGGDPGSGGKGSDGKGSDNKGSDDSDTGDTGTDDSGTSNTGTDDSGTDDSKSGDTGTGDAGTGNPASGDSGTGNANPSPSPMGSPTAPSGATGPGWNILPDPFAGDSKDDPNQDDDPTGDSKSGGGKHKDDIDIDFAFDGLDPGTNPTDPPPNPPPPPPTPPTGGEPGGGKGTDDGLGSGDPTDTGDPSNQGGPADTGDPSGPVSGFGLGFTNDPFMQITSPGPVVPTPSPTGGSPSGGQSQSGKKNTKKVKSKQGSGHPTKGIHAVTSNQHVGQAASLEVAANNGPRFPLPTGGKAVPDGSSTHVEMYDPFAGLRSPWNDTQLGPPPATDWSGDISQLKDELDGQSSKYLGLLELLFGSGTFGTSRTPLTQKEVKGLGIQFDGFKGVLERQLGVLKLFFRYHPYIPEIPPASRQNVADYEELRKRYQRLIVWYTSSIGPWQW